MKREHLYRGQLKSTREWIYGMPSYDFKYIFNADNFDSPDRCEVIPETVGEFCGKFDKSTWDLLTESEREKWTLDGNMPSEWKGKRIFEGDYNADGDMVVWCEKCNGWEFAAIDVPTKDICIPCHRCDGNFYFEDAINDFVIAGNIHN